MNLRTSCATPKRQRGFTLVELMVVVAIVAILAAIAVPLYNEQVRKARRGTAKSDMMELVQELERFHTVNSTYVGFAPVLVNSPDDGTVSYQIAVNGLTATGYTLVATAQGDQTADMCGNITLNQTGEPTFSTGHTKSECWNR